MNTGSHKTFENSVRLGTMLVSFPIDRAWILKKDTVYFTDFWDLPRIASAGRLQDLFGKVLFHINGYDNDERALWEIPEVREYLRNLVNVWPYFFYADNLETPFLCDLIKCIVPSVVVATTENDPTNCTTRIDADDVNQAYGKLLNGLVEACKMDNEMTTETFNAREDAVRKLIQKQFR
jgi:hypothetical protein